jgi:hypothetical protein
MNIVINDFAEFLNVAVAEGHLNNFSNELEFLDWALWTFKQNMNDLNDEGEGE